MPRNQTTTKKPKTKKNLTAGGVFKVATAKTLPGQYRQVAEGRALKTRGGLTKDDIIQNKSGRYVSKKKSERMTNLSAGGNTNPWWTRMQEAKANDEPEFTYTNTEGETIVYKKHITKTGLSTYKRA